MLTGVSWDIFLTIFLFLRSFIGKITTCPKLHLREQLLRHNLSFEFLDQVKGIPKTTMIDSFWMWIDLLHAKIIFVVHWQDRENIFQTISAVFKKFPRLTSKVDCIEIFIEAPKNLLARAQCYSNYKKKKKTKKKNIVLLISSFHVHLLEVLISCQRPGEDIIRCSHCS